MNGPPTQREWENLTQRVDICERQITTLRENVARARGMASVLGFIGGIIAAAIITAAVRAIWG